MAMLNCIKAAIDGGFIKRDVGEDLQARIDERLRAGRFTEAARERLAEEMLAEIRERRRRAMLQEARRRELTEAVLNHRNAKGERAPAEALWMLVEHFGEGKGLDDAETKKWVIIREAHADLAQFLHEFRKGAVTGDLRRRNPELVARMDNIVRELFGQKTGDDRAGTLAKAWSEATEKLRLRGNAAGMWIRKLEDWGLPQSHNPEALIAIGEDAWVEYLLRPGVLDRRKMVSALTGEILDEFELETALRSTWKRITTDGWVEREASFQPFGRGALGKRRDDFHRFIHFADADAWLDYHKNFKAGDPFEGMLGHVSVMARDIATLEVFGPNPEAMRNYLKQVVMRDAAEAVPAKSEIIKHSKAAIDAIEKAVPGDAGKGFVARIRTLMEEMADVSRKGRARGDDDMMKKARANAAEIDRIQEDLLALEPVAMGQRRADLAAELGRVRGEIANIEAKAAPQLGGGLSRRNRQKLERARDREAELASEQAAFDARDTSLKETDPATVQTLQDAFDDLKREIRAVRDGTYAKSANPVEDAKSAIHRHDKMWDIFRGNHYAPINSTFANVMQTSRNLMTASALGSAAITTLADVNNIRLARKMAGMSGSIARIIGGYIEQIGADKVAAMEAGLMLDASVHVMHQQARYLEQTGIMGQSASTMGRNFVQWSGFLGDRVVSMTGMTWLTQGAKWAFGTAMQVEMGKLKGLTIDKLPEAVQRMFERHGIDEAIWNTIRKADLYTPQTGIAYLRPAEILKDAPKPPRQMDAGKVKAEIGRRESEYHSSPEAVMQPDPYGAFQEAARKLSDATNNAFQVHGISASTDRLGSLLDLLRNGIDPNRTFHSGPPKGGVYGVNTTRASAPFLILSDKGKTIKDTGVKNVVLNGPGEAALDALREAFPTVNFMTVAEGMDFMQTGKVPSRRPAVEPPGDPLRRQAFEKYLGMIHRETRYAVVENTVRSRSFAGSERRGTAWGEFMLSAMQFKSFGLVHAIMQIGRIVREVQGGRANNAIGMSAGLVVGGAIIGSIINELHNIVNGRDPQISSVLAKGELPGWKYWSHGLMRAGGLGIFGDVLFAPINIYGGLGEFMLGPVLGRLETLRKGTLNDTLDTIEGKGKEGKTSRRLISFADSVTPGSSIWYLKLLKQRLVTNQLQLALDPHAREVFHRHEQLQRKNYDNAYWWRPGEAAPARPPMFVPDKQIAAQTAARTSSKKGLKTEAQAPVVDPSRVPTMKVGERIEASQAKPFTVVDGDTLLVGGQRWRIEGYDAPEVYSRAKAGERSAGMRAALRLQDLLRSGKAEIEVSNPPDRWGRGRARLTVDGEDVAKIMKREGHTKFERRQ